MGSGHHRTRMHPQNVFKIRHDFLPPAEGSRPAVSGPPKSFGCRRPPCLPSRGHGRRAFVFDRPERGWRRQKRDGGVVGAFEPASGVRLRFVDPPGVQVASSLRLARKVEWFSLETKGGRFFSRGTPPGHVASLKALALPRKLPRRCDGRRHAEAEAVAAASYPKSVEPAPIGGSAPPHAAAPLKCF